MNMGPLAIGYKGVCVRWKKKWSSPVSWSVLRDVCTLTCKKCGLRVWETE